MTFPKLVLVFSGKRKSGKDYLTGELLNLVREGAAVIIRLSGPLKEAYAKEHGLDFARLLDASSYKERYRSDMVVWGEKRRDENPGFFCELAIDKYEAKKFPVWIVSDARRPTDVDYFRSHYPQQTKLCRINADAAVRTSRGWTYAAGVDDRDTECALDKYKDWDMVFDNDGSTAAEVLLKPCLDLISLAIGGG